ncbi:MAG: hypothetical protein Q4C52_08745 [Eubacteriales bacterium]|nr:hypothetical protein [Eubacteriales bacterium]
MLKVKKAKTEWLLLLGYLSFIGFSILVEIVTIRLFLPVLLGDESIYWLDNQAVSIFFTLIAMAIPIPVESVIAKFTHVVVTQKIDTFWEEVYICERQINIKNNRIEANKYIIDDVAKGNDINIEFLKTILNLECFYRERLYNRFAEVIITRFFSHYAIKRDISVGIAQIKISTAQKILRENPHSFVKGICDDEMNIKLCGKYIKILIEEYYFRLENEQGYMESRFTDVYDYVACQYLGGIPDNKERTILIYSAVLRSVLKDAPVYYCGSNDSDKYYLTLKGNDAISYMQYKELKERVSFNGIIQREVYVNSLEFVLEMEIICASLYDLQAIRELAEAYNISVAFG